MYPLPKLEILSVKIPVTDITESRLWYQQAFDLVEELEWPDPDGIVRGVAFAGLGGVMLALREHPQAAAATTDFGFMNVKVPTVADLSACADHLDRLGIPHTDVISGARGQLVGFHDLDGHELSFYAETESDGVRDDAVRRVRLIQRQG